MREGSQRRPAGVRAATQGRWLDLDSNEEVDALNRSWIASQARLLGLPESKPWGLHAFTAVDPDGNLLRVFHDFGTAGRAEGG